MVYRSVFLGAHLYSRTPPWSFASSCWLASLDQNGPNEWLPKMLSPVLQTHLISAVSTWRAMPSGTLYNASDPLLRAHVPVSGCASPATLGRVRGRGMYALSLRYRRPIGPSRGGTWATELSPVREDDLLRTAAVSLESRWQRPSRVRRGTGRRCHSLFMVTMEAQGDLVPRRVVSVRLEWHQDNERLTSIVNGLGVSVMGRPPLLHLLLACSRERGLRRT